MLRAALLDLDGTLLDSMRVWDEVDRIFLGRRGIQVPADYAGSINGMSFRATAEYTIRRFALSDTPEQLMEEWTAIAREEYTLHIPLKPGAAEFLSFLADSGIRICAVTTLVEELFRPCLTRCGIINRFSFIHVAKKGTKEDGTAFLEAADRLGVKPEECAVFEDSLPGILGAKNAGMTACAVPDRLKTEKRKALIRAADMCSDRFSDFYRLFE